MDATIIRLTAEWRADMAALGAESGVAQSTFDEIIRRHSEPHRRYHGPGHLEALFRLLAMHAPDVKSGSSSRLAVWWHDVVYDPMASDNEERSADFAAAALPGLGATPDVVAEVARLIRMTKNHWAGGSANQGDLFLDADIAILGAPSAVYDVYAAGVRQEYIFAPDDIYRAGRSHFLSGALARDRYFRTDVFETAYAKQTRENIARELASLA